MAPLGPQQQNPSSYQTILRLSYLRGYGNCPLSQLGTTPGTRIAPQILLRRPFSSADFGGCFFGLDIHLILSAQATAKSRKGKHSFNRNQPGMLPQTVTTVWRTKLGTTLLIGFNNSTGLSAYFRYLGISQSPPKRRITPSSSPVWPRG